LNQEDKTEHQPAYGKTQRSYREIILSMAWFESIFSSRLNFISAGKRLCVNLYFFPGNQVDACGSHQFYFVALYIHERKKETNQHYPKQAGETSFFFSLIIN